jgi:hypothetical protein
MVMKIFRRPTVSPPLGSDVTVTEPMINFFDTFGFLKIEGFFDQEYSLISERFDRLMRDKFGSTNEPRNYLFPQFIDNDPQLADLLCLPKLQVLASALLGHDFVYKGSDGNVFGSPTPWHRDYLIRTRSIKLLIYLESNDNDGGALRVIPGTQFVDDNYSSLIGRALTWPEPPVAGGFDETGWFGRGHNPTVERGNQTLPQVVVTNRPGDLIVFNHNLVHCTNLPARPKRRRLLGLHFCTNPGRMAQFDEVTRGEIRTLSLVEMETFGLTSMFGPYVMEHPAEAVQRMIGPLKDLTLEPGAEFDGAYERQSASSVTLCNRLKRTHFDSTQHAN